MLLYGGIQALVAKAVVATTTCIDCARDCDCDKDDLQMSTMTMFDGLRSEHKARADTRDPCIRYLSERGEKELAWKWETLKY